MEIKTTRLLKGKNTTLSHLLVNEIQYCYALEDVDRGLTQAMPVAKISRIKMPARTAIPAGRYRVQITWSNRFKREMIQLMDVPGFAGIRVHPGNWHTNTEGCILPGMKYGTKNGDYMVRDSRKASGYLDKIVLAAIKAGEEVWWTITDHYQ